MKNLLSIIIFLIVYYSSLISQENDINISHPVYSFLKKCETQSLLPNYSLSDLPWRKSKIISALILIDKNKTLLTENELSTLNFFLTEFQITNRDNAVLIESSSDDDQIFFSNIISNKEKFIYFNKDSSNEVGLEPLLAFDYFLKTTTSNDSNYAAIGHLGFRLSGDFDKNFGFNLQVTNGTLFKGYRSVAFEDPHYAQNIKFNNLKNDIDYTESHINYRSNWFLASIGRESRIMGSGLDQKIIISSRTPAFDAIILGAKFTGFEYKFVHGSLLGLTEQVINSTGFNLKIPAKYFTMHRFSVIPKWGEFSFWESAIYTDRYPDLAYINPLNFIKSIEHSLRDRDNAAMGVDCAIRPFAGLQLMFTYFLDDIIFGEIGSGFWSNKSAWNFGFNTTFIKNIEFGAEYSRIEPYTFTHFNRQNSFTNDGILIGPDIYPNSHKFLVKTNWWWGERYPITLTYSYIESGTNIFNANGELIKNVGSDPSQTIRPIDPQKVIFLDGKQQFISTLDFQIAYEIFRGLNILFNYKIRSLNGEFDNLLRVVFKFQEF